MNGDKTWGPEVWQKLHTTVEAIPCDGCRSVATRVMRGFHDAVNAELRKPILYPADLAYAAMFLTRANLQCIKAGSCSKKYKCNVEKGCRATR